MKNKGWKQNNLLVFPHLLLPKLKTELHTFFPRAERKQQPSKFLFAYKIFYSKPSKKFVMI